jgi:hypothetical protein
MGGAAPGEPAFPVAPLSRVCFGRGDRASVCPWPPVTLTAVLFIAAVFFIAAQLSRPHTRVRDSASGGAGVYDSVAAGRGVCDSAAAGRAFMTPSRPGEACATRPRAGRRLHDSATGGAG